MHAFAGSQLNFLQQLVLVDTAGVVLPSWCSAALLGSACHMHVTLFAAITLTANYVVHNVWQYAAVTSFRYSLLFGLLWWVQG